MKLCTLLALVIISLAGPAFAKDKGKDTPKDSGKRVTSITLDQCPEPVQAAIQAYKPTATEIESEQEKGAITYDAKLTLPDGKRLKVLFAPDGKVLESKEKKAK